MSKPKKRLLFLTGTRADFGKLKSLIALTQASDDYQVNIFATGMHLDDQYGRTVDEIYKSNFKHIYEYKNYSDSQVGMDKMLAKTIDGFSCYVQKTKPDLIIVHGDRIEALAGAIVGSLNNILVAHIEGGELSGTIDELIRHAVSKLSHIHLVANDTAKKRLLQLGELEKSIFVIGSPDVDLMNSNTLPSLEEVNRRYQINFHQYAIALFHPVTTEQQQIKKMANNFVKALLESQLNYVVIYPNNDWGNKDILLAYQCIENHFKFRVFPSVRFEYFLTLIRHCMFMVGNSSAGIREAPYYDIPTVDIGSRQHNRMRAPSIFHCEHEKNDILMTIDQALNYQHQANNNFNCQFGDGKSALKFLQLLDDQTIWQTNHQKQFQDL